MKILLIKRLIPHSIMVQMQSQEVVEVEHEVLETRELTPLEFKKVNQFQQWATRQRNLIYDELNESVKEARK
jgi:hypothetical protein